MTCVANVATFGRAIATVRELADEGISAGIRPTDGERFEIHVDEDKAERTGDLLARGW